MIEEHAFFEKLQANLGVRAIESITNGINTITYVCGHGIPMVEVISSDMVEGMGGEKAARYVLKRLEMHCCNSHASKDKSTCAVQKSKNGFWKKGVGVPKPKYSGNGNWVPYNTGFTISMPISDGWSASVMLTGNKAADTLTELVPAIKTAMVRCPGKDVIGNRCQEAFAIIFMIPHINDTHKWTREAIADWLETLPSDIDLTIRPKEKNNAAVPGAKEAVSGYQYYQIKAGQYGVPSSSYCGDPYCPLCLGGKV